MILPLAPLALGAIVFSSIPFSLCLAPSDIPADTPVSQILSSATKELAAGNAHDALTYFDAAIARDPQNYLSLFKRGAAYLSLGRNTQAQQDFDRVLAIKPGFEGALLQRARIKARNGEWEAAKKDYKAAGKSDGQELEELEEAEGAATLAEEAAAKGDWEACITQAGVAIRIAGTALDLRKLRAKCRLERGEVMEGISDLQHVLQISSGSVEPHLQISAMTFYSLGETEKGLAAIRKCLHSDPDSKACMKLMKREKAVDKQLKKARQAMEKRQFSSAVKFLVKSGEDSGLLQDVKDDIKRYKDEGYIAKKASDGLYIQLLQMTCEAYTEMNNKKRGRPYCMELLSLDPHSLLGLVAKAEKQMEDDEFESAVRTLNEANEHHPGNDKVHQLLQKAQQMLHRSKQKDYYKVLGVSRDADEKEIKKAYRRLTKQFHPDKASQSGLTKEEAETKMAAINEAYEVLSDPELKARFDRGDDPNNPEQQQGNPFQGSPFGQGPGGPQFVFRQGPGRGFQGGTFKFQQGAGGFQFPGDFGFP